MLALAIAAAAGGYAFAEDWPQFRGPNGAGISYDAPPPLTWSESENLLWKTPLPGPGSSSPIVVGDRVFVTSYSGYGDGQDSGRAADLQRHLLCVDRKSGDVRWQTSVDAVTPEDPYQGFITEHGYASSTPVCDGMNVYVFFGKSGVLAFDMEGKQLWRTSVGTGSDPRAWGSAASPVLYGDTVIVNAAAESEKLFGLNRATGDVVWESDAGGAQNSWSTPIFRPTAEGREEMILLVPDEVWGLNPENGKLRWYCEADMQQPVCTSPVGDAGVAYAIGGRQGGGTAVKLGGRGDVTESHRIWETRDSSYVPSPVVHERQLHWVNDRGIAYCLDTTDGETIYEERLQSSGPAPRFYASIVLVGDRIYAVSRNAGTFVLRAGGEFEQLAQNRFESDGADFNGSPALNDGQMFLRSNRFLYCVGEKR
ncbi:MAG: PQQ-like beta-propeller repeat protein [Planctomycetes bacterium]|nr:PQQ-like beta-propeller repeat protein [Planctomycetota bacterium]